MATIKVGPGGIGDYRRNVEKDPLRETRKARDIRKRVLSSLASRRPELDGSHLIELTHSLNDGQNHSLGVFDITLKRQYITKKRRGAGIVYFVSEIDQT